MTQKKKIAEETQRQNKKRLLEVFEKSPFAIVMNCKAAKVSYTTYSKYLREDSDFAEAIENTKKIRNEDLNKLASDNLREALLERDDNGRMTKAAISATFYIKNNIAKIEGFNVKEEDNKTELENIADVMAKVALSIKSNDNIEVVKSKNDLSNE